MKSCLSIAAYRDPLCTFLSKITSPAEMKHFRGIVLLSVLSKWYTGCLVLLAQKLPHPAPMARVCVVGYEKEHSTSHITGQLQLLCARATEWYPKVHLNVFQGDIWKAVGLRNDR